ncbi:TadG [Vibrio sp. D404a]|uniref:TadE/TadG family type IV pilus assembly protein n=1 Tax=unclassified Vibrio TaxID=2614977 RepID=UPI00255558DB|nr:MULTISPECIES: pilus assembly protein TadG-related protein [unclassified Vibrio]MDK9737085.1 TadG [Vibrio sp. D404a]MDK9798232.1 TadG [Vibrio sp. D449a]
MFRIKQQGGHASILFVLFMPMLFMLFTLALDGAHAMQNKARLGDAAELAALSLSAHDASNGNSSGEGSGSKVNRDIAINVINHYLGGNGQLKDLKIFRSSCEDIPECLERLKRGGKRYHQYKVSAIYEESSWLPGWGQDEEVDNILLVSGSSTAFKYQAEKVDVFFVADYSNSMNDSWSGSGKKYEDMNNVIQEVVDELKMQDNPDVSRKHRVGIVPFFIATPTKVIGEKSYCKLSQVYERNEDYDINSADPKIPQLQFESINYRDALKNIWKEKSEKNCLPMVKKDAYVEKGEKAFRKNKKQKRYEVYTEMKLTSDFNYFNSRISEYRPLGWGTHFISGLTRAAKLLEGDSYNSKRIIIILSDGVEVPKYISGSVVKGGLCKMVMEKLNTGTNDLGEPLHTRIAGVGFDYDTSKNVALINCLGEGNVFKAQDRDELKSKILELVSEEIGRLK